MQQHACQKGVACWIKGSKWWHPWNAQPGPSPTTTTADAQDGKDADGRDIAKQNTSYPHPEPGDVEELLVQSRQRHAQETKMWGQQQETLQQVIVLLQKENEKLNSEMQDKDITAAWMKVDLQTMQNKIESLRDEVQAKDLRTEGSQTDMQQIHGETALLLGCQAQQLMHTNEVAFAGRCQDLEEQMMRQAELYHSQQTTRFEMYHDEEMAQAAQKYFTSEEVLMKQAEIYHHQQEDMTNRFYFATTELQEMAEEKDKLERADSWDRLFADSASAGFSTPMMNLLGPTPFDTPRPVMVNLEEGINLATLNNLMPGLPIPVGSLTDPTQQVPPPWPEIAMIASTGNASIDDPMHSMSFAALPRALWPNPQETPAGSFTYGLDLTLPNPQDTRSDLLQPLDENNEDTEDNAPGAASSTLEDAAAQANTATAAGVECSNEELESHAAPESLHETITAIQQDADVEAETEDAASDDHENTASILFLQWDGW